MSILNRTFLSFLAFLIAFNFIITPKLQNVYASPALAPAAVDAIANMLGIAGASYASQNNGFTDADVKDFFTNGYNGIKQDAQVTQFIIDHMTDIQKTTFERLFSESMDYYSTLADSSKVYVDQTVSSIKSAKQFTSDQLKFLGWDLISALAVNYFKNFDNYPSSVIQKGNYYAYYYNAPINQAMIWQTSSPLHLVRTGAPRLESSGSYTLTYVNDDGSVASVQHGSGLVLPFDFNNPYQGYYLDDGISHNDFRPLSVDSFPKTVPVPTSVPISVNSSGAASLPIPFNLPSDVAGLLIGAATIPVSFSNDQVAVGGAVVPRNPADTTYDAPAIPNSGTDNPPTTTTGEYTGLLGSILGSLQGIQSWANSLFAPATVSLNFAPLQLTGTKFSSVFPFSVPWDLKNSISSLAADPEPPKFVVDLNSWNVSQQLRSFTGSGDYKIEVNFDQFEIWAKIIRWGVLVTFLISLIIVTRNLIRG